MKPLQSILIKPAGPDCNLACEYCFYLEKAGFFPETKIHRMSDEILRETIRQMMQQGDTHLSFGWQGGEPTLLGLDFFRQAVKYQREFGRGGQVVGNGLQTNGILIDSDWAHFLREFRFLVGLSLDGPQAVHDHYRRFAGGQSSWDKVCRARDTLLHAGVEVNALVVVSDYSVQFPGEIYDFHKAHGLNFMQFIPCVETDPQDPGRATNFSVSGPAYGKFLCELFDRWLGDFRYGEPTTSIRWFDSVFYSYVDLPAPECTLLPECGVYVVVEHNGDVFACDFFVDSAHRLGNVQNDRLIDLLNAPRQTEFGAAKRQLPPACVECPWLKHCWGGCPKDRRNDPRDQGLNHFCEAFQIFFRHADEPLKKMAREWQKQQATIPKPSPAVVRENIGRNDLCPCGSGKKFKKCCGRDR